MSHSKIFDSTPKQTDPIETRYRRIVTPIPHPDTLPTLDTLREFEPISMGGQPPIRWEKAEGFSVFDVAGNKWMTSRAESSSPTAASHPKLRAALIDQIENGVISYCFPNKPRAELVRRLVQLAGAH